MGIQKYQRNQHHVRFADTSRIDLISSRLIFVFVEQKVFFRRIVGPNLLDTFIYVAFVLNLLKVLKNLEGST